MEFVDFMHLKTFREPLSRIVQGVQGRNTTYSPHWRDCLKKASGLQKCGVGGQERRGKASLRPLSRARGASSGYRRGSSDKSQKVHSGEFGVFG